MFLHLGNDVIIPLRELISIHDYKEGRSAINRQFIQNMKSKRQVVELTADKPKSFIITDRKIYFSAISAMTLKKRAGFLQDTEIKEHHYIGRSG